MIASNTGGNLAPQRSPASLQWSRTLITSWSRGGRLADGEDPWKALTSQPIERTVIGDIDGEQAGDSSPTPGASMGQQHQADRIPNDRSAGRIGELAAFAATGAGSGYSGPEKPDRRDLTRFVLSRTGFIACARRRPTFLGTGNGSSRRTVRVLSLCPG